MSNSSGDAERVRVVELRLVSDDFAADVRRGLTSSPKTLDSKYFYDELGTALFEAICLVPEYYVGRAELEILATKGAEIVEALGQPVRLIELGSGTSRKTRLLIRPILERQQRLDYFPIDLDSASLVASAGTLVTEYEGLHVTALLGTFESAIEYLATNSYRPGERRLVLFLGSTIGNLEVDARQNLLRLLRGLLRPGEAVLLGADRVMDEAVLVPAYDDILGVTAAFDRNVLVRMNRELDGTFDLATFRHMARYDTHFERTEMHVVSTVDQNVRVAGIDVHFREGESIKTENSYKFSPEKIETLARETGFEVTRSWFDAGALFGSYLLTAV